MNREGEKKKLKTNPKFWGVASANGVRGANVAAVVDVGLARAKAAGEGDGPCESDNHAGIHACCAVRGATGVFSVFPAAPESSGFCFCANLKN